MTPYVQPAELVRYRRKYTRHGLDASVEVHGPGFTVACATDDLSAGGCCLRFEPAPPVDTLLSVKVSAHGSALTPYGSARVAWARDGRIGLAFGHRLIHEVIPFLRAVVGPDEPLETPEGH